VDPAEPPDPDDVREAAARAPGDVAALARAALARAEPSRSPRALGAFFLRPSRPLPYSSTAAGTLDVYDALAMLDASPDVPGAIRVLYGGGAIRRGARNMEHVEGWNREHAWPQSRGGMDTSSPGMATDLHNIFAAESRANSSRSNKAYGVVVGGVVPLGGDLLGAAYTRDSWMPPPRARGIVARALLYMACAYAGEGLRLVAGPGDPSRNEMGDARALLAWNAEHPPTASERARNDAVEDLQGNRNPFVDAPYLAEAVRWF
jgi:endonuclease I